MLRLHDKARGTNSTGPSTAGGVVRFSTTVHTASVNEF